MFMAICLQEKYANAISGVAELTALALPGSQQSFPMKGLTGEKIVKVLKSPTCGLNAFLETVPAGSETQGMARQRKTLTAAIRGYLRSGMPVMCLIDMALLAKTVWPKNRVTVKGEPVLTGKHRPNHAVLLVGCDKENGLSYLMNDPASYPLMEATYDDVYAVRQFGESEQGNSPQIIPVLPNKVRSPLLGGNYPDGVLWCAELLQVLTRDTADDAAIKEHWPGEWRLVDFGKQANELERDFYSMVGVGAGHEWSDICKRLTSGDESAELPDAGWHWVQWLADKKDAGKSPRGELWIWNAEAAVGSVGGRLKSANQQARMKFRCDGSRMRLVRRYP